MDSSHGSPGESGSMPGITGPAAEPSREPVGMAVLEAASPPASGPGESQSRRPGGGPAVEPGRGPVGPVVPAAVSASAPANVGRMSATATVSRQPTAAAVSAGVNVVLSDVTEEDTDTEEGRSSPVCHTNGNMRQTMCFAFVYPTRQICPAIYMFY